MFRKYLPLYCFVALIALFMLVGQYQQNAPVLVGGGVGRGLYGRGEGCNQWRIAWDSYAREGQLTAKPDKVRVSPGGPKWTVDRTVFEMWLGAL